MATTLTPAPSVGPPIVNARPDGDTRQDILTSLNYWKRSKDQSVCVDFSAPGAQERYKELSKLDEAHSVLIHDVRGEESKYTLEHHGFQYVQHKVTGLRDWSNEDEVKAILIPATEQLVKQITGAAEVITFTHRIRCLAKDVRQLASSQAPAHDVHADFTPAGALKHLQDTIPDEAERNRLMNGRVLAMNVWRPLNQVRKDPLAICDWTSVNLETDIVAYRLIFPNGWKELARANFNPKHAWYYLGGQRPDEPLLFKQFDSQAKDGTNLLHTAFVDPEFVGCEPRESIEIKMFAFIPN